MYKVNPKKIKKNARLRLELQNSSANPRILPTGKQPRVSGKPLQCKTCKGHMFTTFCANTYACDKCDTTYYLGD